VGRNVQYLDQPWEQDAFARQEIIFRKAIEWSWQRSKSVVYSWL
jgi:hypothetical protein